MASTNEVHDIVNIDVVDQKQKDRLSQKLKTELESLEQQFVVDKAKLKAIAERFQEELEEGLKDNGQNIVSYAIWFSNHELTCRGDVCHVGAGVSIGQGERLISDGRPWWHES